MDSLLFCQALAALLAWMPAAAFALAVAYWGFLQRAILRRVLKAGRQRQGDETKTVPNKRIKLLAKIRSALIELESPTGTGTSNTGRCKAALQKSWGVL